MNDTTVKIYTSPTCDYCQMARDYFKKHGIEYQEVDVTQDEQAREKMIQKSHQLGVPVIEIDNEIYVGFHRREIAKKLDLEEQKNR